MAEVITLYKDAFSSQRWYVDAHEAMLQILTGSFSEQVNYLRSLDKATYDKEKLKLPALTWSGTFTERLDVKVEEYSGLICLDIDHIEMSVIEALKPQLNEDPYVRYAFISPSNSGIKIIVKVNTGKEHHKAAFLHLQKVFEEKYFLSVDPSGKNVARLCFVSSDDKAIVKETSEVFEVDIKMGVAEPVISDRSKFSNYQNSSDNNNIFKTCVKWVERTMEYKQGGRNHFIHALACALNRTGVPIDEAEFMILAEYADFEQKEAHQCCKSAYFRNQHEHGTVAVKDIGVGDFKAPPYVANYTDDVVLNDLMRITALMYHHKVNKRDIMDVVGKIALYYKKEGYIDLDRKSLVDLMGASVKVLQENIKKDSSLSSMKYETAEDLGMELVDINLVEGVVPTHIVDFDGPMRGGMMPGNFYGLIGVGGTYKSVLSEFWAYKNAMIDIPTLYLSGEMSKFQFYERLALMAMGVNLYGEISQGRLSKENISSFIESMETYTKKNIFIVHGNGFGRQNIVSTIENIEASTGKKIKLVVIDGISQMDSCGKEEIPAAIHNAAVCKEVAKETNTVVVGLMHVSGDNNKVLRDTGLKARGGIKMTANADGYFSTSLLVDPVTNELDNSDDVAYRHGMFYLRLVDKRTPAGIISKIIQVENNLHLTALSDNPNNYEIKINRR